MSLKAVIDLGSSQLMLKIAEVTATQPPRVVEQVRGSLALGEDTYTSHRISEENIRHCCEILNHFRKKLAEYKLSEAKVVATSAIREAYNRDYVLTRIRQETGFEVEILDNNIERYYHKTAMTEHLPEFPEMIKQGVVVLDIGAGSIQISKYDANGLAYSHNLLLGALRVHEMMDRLKDKTRDYTKLLDEYITSELNDFMILEGDPGGKNHFIALGAELPYLKKLAGLKQDVETMDTKQFTDLLDLLRQKKPLELTTKHGIPAHVAELLLPAATILEKYAADARGHIIYMPTSDLCESLLLEHSSEKKKRKLNYLHSNDVLTSTRHIANRFRYDKKHTEVVTAHALKIFDVLKKAYKLTDRQRLYLEIAGILHDSGKFIQVNRHSHQSFHIIKSLDIFGITDRERLMIAYIARFHSATWSPKREDMPELELEERQSVLQMAAILRLADSFDASHTQKLAQMLVRIKNNRLIVSIDASVDTTLETSSASEKSQLLLEVYGLVLEFKFLASDRFEREG